MPIEIRRFGVGHRRPDGPPGSIGLTGQVIHSDGRGIDLRARVRARARASSRTRTRTRPGSSSSRAAAGSASARSGRGSPPARRCCGRPTSSTRPGPSTPRCARSSSSSPAPTTRGRDPRPGARAGPGRSRRRSSTRRWARSPTTGQAGAPRRRRTASPTRPVRSSVRRGRAPSWLRIRAVAPQTDRPSTVVGAVAQRPAADRRARPSAIGAPGRNVATRGSTIRATSAGEATRIGRRVGDGHDRRHLEVADRDPEPLEPADHPNARGVGVQADLLGRLAQGGRLDVGVVRLGLAARKADLAAVVAVAGRPLGQDDPRVAVVVRVERGPARPPAGSTGRGRRRRPGGARRPSPCKTGISSAAGAGSGSGQSPAARGRRTARVVADDQPADGPTLS